MFLRKIKKSLLSCVFIITGVLVFSLKSFGVKREYFLIGLDKGITYYWAFKEQYDPSSENKRFQFHTSYNLQLYPLASLGIQWENKIQAEGFYSLINLIFKIQKYKNSGIWPYLSFGFGYKLLEAIATIETTKVGGGLKYRIFKESTQFVVQMNSGIFLFLSENQHLSFSLGIEGGF